MNSSRWGLVILGCLLAGCNSAQRVSTFKFWPKPAAAPATAEQAEPPIKLVDDEHMESRRSRSESSRKIKHDPETANMIADELETVDSPTERLQMEKDWSETPSKMVRELIQLRREKRYLTAGNSARPSQPERPNWNNQNSEMRSFPAAPGDSVARQPMDNGSASMQDDAVYGNRAPAGDQSTASRYQPSRGMGASSPWGNSQENRTSREEPVAPNRMTAQAPERNPYEPVSQQRFSPDRNNAGPIPDSNWQRMPNQQGTSRHTGYPQYPGDANDGFPPVFDRQDGEPSYLRQSTQSAAGGPTNTQPIGNRPADTSPYYENQPNSQSPGYPNAGQSRDGYPPADQVFGPASQTRQFNSQSGPPGPDPYYQERAPQNPGTQNFNEQYPIQGRPTSSTRGVPQDPLVLTPEHQKLIEMAEAEVATVPVGKSEAEVERYTQAQVNLRMLYFLAGQPERSIQPIPHIPASEQEFWQQVFWGLANYFDRENMPRQSERATRTIAQLQKAVHQLQGRADLELQNVCFCQRIQSFGNYDKFPADHFSRGQPVALYVEVKNFGARAGPRGETVETALRSRIEVYTPGPNPQLVDGVELPISRETTRTPRQDYYQSYNFQIPPTLSLGPHVLKLTVEDLHGKKVASKSLNFTVR